MTSHGSRFAHQALPEYVFDNPLAFARAIADQRRRAGVLNSTWERAGAQLSASDRLPATGIDAAFHRADDFTIIRIDPPLGTEACSIVVVARGDGEFAFDNPTCFIVEPRVVGGVTTFMLVSRKADAEETASHGDVDPNRYLAQCLELVGGSREHAKQVATPAWYWWYAFGGADVMKTFHTSPEDQAWTVVHQHPILLLPELVDAAERVLGPTPNLMGLRQMHQSLRGSTYDAAFHILLANRLANEASGSPRVNVERAVEVIADLRTRTGGPDVDAAAAEIERKRASHSPQQGAAPVTDTTWHSMFFDELRGYARFAHDDKRDAGSTDSAFRTNGGSNAGTVEWRGPDNWAVHRIIDARWLFPTTKAATAFFQALAVRPTDNLPVASAPSIGADAVHAWGGRTKSHIIMFRLGRAVGQIIAHEGPRAAAVFQTIQQEMIVPFAHEAANRVRWALARYWSGIGRAVEAAQAFAQTSPRTAQQLFPQYPILALPELPMMMAALGEPLRSAANTLIEAQGQLKTNWKTYRDVSRALVRELLDERAGDARVNADAALNLVIEIRRHDTDYSWVPIENECRARL